MAKLKRNIGESWRKTIIGVISVSASAKKAKNNRQAKAYGAWRRRNGTSASKIIMKSGQRKSASISLMSIGSRSNIEKYQHESVSMAAKQWRKPGENENIEIERKIKMATMAWRMAWQWHGISVSVISKASWQQIMALIGDQNGEKPWAMAKNHRQAAKKKMAKNGVTAMARGVKWRIEKSMKK
jgi:hypothetical protein